MARRLRNLLVDRYPYLVAEREGAITGYPYARPYRARPAYRWSVEDSICVAPDFHRRRIGSLLLARLIEEGEVRGFRQMIAVIGDSTQAPSFALHAAGGFAPVGMLRPVGFKHSRWLDTVLVQRPLGSVATTLP